MRVLVLCMLCGLMIAALGCGRSKSDSPSSWAHAAAVLDDAAPGSSKSVGNTESARSASAATDSKPRPPVDAKTTFQALLEAHRRQRPDDWEKASEQLLELHVVALPAYIEAIQSGDRDARELATMLLAQVGPDAAPAKDALLRVLDDESANVRVNAASTLSQFPETADHILPVLAKLVAHYDVNVRQIAVFSLGNLQESIATTVPMLVGTLDDSSPAIQTTAAELLGEIGPKAESAVPRLEALQDAQDEALRTAAAEALKRIRPAPSADASKQGTPDAKSVESAKQ